ILLFFFWLVLVFFDSTAKGDFEIFVEASKDLFNLKNIYTTFYNHYFHYYYSVLFAVIIYPFTFLNFYFVKVIWMICNYIFTYRILKNGAFFLNLRDEDNKAKFIVLFVSFLLVFALWHRNIALAQVTIFVLFLMLESFTLILKNHVLLPALLLAFGIDFKIMPIVCLPYLLYRGYNKVVFTSLIFLLTSLLLPSVFI
ncbi:MAG: glycosyltransferase family 87 protein, partial [Bacteroidota bacterium]